MSKYIYLVNMNADTDHCSECGAEEYEGTTGSLKTYLFVDTGSNVLHMLDLRDGHLRTLSTTEHRVLCNDCADMLWVKAIDSAGA